MRSYSGGRLSTHRVRSAAGRSSASSSKRLSVDHTSTFMALGFVTSLAHDLAKQQAGNSFILRSDERVVDLLAARKSESELIHEPMTGS